MNVKVNGKPREVEEGTTVAVLIEALGLGPRRVVVEHNGCALERGSFVSTTLRPGDVVEIVRAVPGG